jgi:subtilisin family serine protease
MKKGTIVFTGAVASLAFVLCLSSGGGPRAGQDAVRAGYAPDRLLVKFKDDPGGLPAGRAKGVIEAAHGLKELRHFPSIDVRLYGTPGPMEKFRKELARNPNVAYAEPDYLRTTGATFPNDPSFSQLWGLHNTGQTGGTADADIDAPEAWDLSRGSSTVIVGVIDSGVEYTHSDLAANMWTNPGETPGNGLDDDHNGYIDDVYGINAITGTGNPMDDNGHGTHCSGTIAGVGNNGVGVAGVCWTARIMALKFLDSHGFGYDSDAIECIEYAVAKGARILNNSYGSYGYNQAMKDAIDAAGAAGALFLAAAGNETNDNDGSESHYPSSYASPSIIAVASTDHNDNLSTFSNFGLLSVDVAAPGSSIYSTFIGNSYAFSSGTSMAAPHVSGLAALIQSFHPSLGWTEIKSRILSGADPLASLQGKVLTGARINAYASLAMADVASYDLVVQSSPASGAAVAVSPADLDGLASGTTTFTRRFAPYMPVTLTAPLTIPGYEFGYWTLEGVRVSTDLIYTLALDYDHALAASYVLSLSEAVDNTALSFVAGGHQGGWHGQTSIFYSGGDAAESNAIGGRERGYMQTSVRGPGDLSFHWKVSSEPIDDYLSFSVDGLEADRISGSVDWRQETFAIGTGLHVLQWNYAKDASTDAGSDLAWVDAVQFSGTAATIGQALEQESLAWVTGGDGGWFPQGVTYHYDGDAARSSELLDQQEAFVGTTVTGQTGVSFYWKVSSEADYDYLSFFIDGALQGRISGAVDWQRMDFPMDAGTHTLRWIYAKDASVAAGSDCGWLDQVAFGDMCSLTIATATVDGIDGGTTTPAPGIHAYEAGTEVDVSAFPAADFRFESWTGNVESGHEYDNPLQVAVNANLTLTANFLRIIYAPANLHGEQAENHSLFLSETINELTWSDNPLNTSDYLDIAKYRISTQVGGTWVPLGEVDAGVHTFWHRGVDPDDEYTYGVCAVSDAGREGERATVVFGDWSIEGGTAARSVAAAVSSGAAPGSAGKSGARLASVPGSSLAGDPAGPPFRGERDGAGTSIVLSWDADAVGADAVGYRIYLVRKGVRTLLAGVGAGVRTYTHRDVEAREMYAYALVPIAADGREGRAVRLDVK